ncbi:hypothetical protein [Cupriavidus sp. BIC8F]|uniref:hypothetical protein n=1 Tax=Cupriavidus sp. BIC8F TaxID=3079014 RepID=UPI00291658E9|nr:hypothetical protein [Cupriavidus sp. BIC8F]
MRVTRLAAAVALPFALVLAGCDTDQELLTQRLEVLKAEEAALKDLKATVATGVPSLTGPGAVSVFLSADLINGILKGADGVDVPVPHVEGATVTVKSIRTDFKMGYPLLRIEATGKKKGLDAELALVGVARLMPTIVAGAAGKSSQLELKVHVDSMVPSAKWAFLDFRLSGFVRDLMQVKVNNELRTAGVIRVPVETDIPLNVPAKETPIQFTGVLGVISTPDLSLKGKAAVNKVVVLPDGIHVYGKVNVDSEA